MPRWQNTSRLDWLKWCWEVLYSEFFSNKSVHRHIPLTAPFFRFVEPVKEPKPGSYLRAVAARISFLGWVGFGEFEGFFQAMESERSWRLQGTGFCLWSLQTILSVGFYNPVYFYIFFPYKCVEGFLLLLCLVFFFYGMSNKGIEEFSFSEGEFITFPILCVSPPLLLSQPFSLRRTSSVWILLLQAYTAENVKTRNSLKLRVLWLKLEGGAEEGFTIPAPAEGPAPFPPLRPFSAWTLPFQKSSARIPCLHFFSWPFGVILWLTRRTKSLVIAFPFFSEQGRVGSKRWYLLKRHRAQLIS